MKRFLSFFFIFGIICLMFNLLQVVKPVFAIENPLGVPNNKVGIHILFTSELSDAARLINSSGGDYGYVTIPLQAGDRDLKKWQSFMDQCKKLHVIPLIRLATEGDYFNTKVWRQPNQDDILDFANFLNSLAWPYKNKYIIVFNEVNRGDEWGGNPDPAGYANLLSYAVSVFKSKNPDFFIISAGLDNAAANTSFSMNEYTFLRGMNSAVPGIFNQIDGLGSHDYPNPAFSQPPNVLTSESIDTFSFEKNLVGNMSNKDLPIFITETGWSKDNLSEQTIGSYFQTAFTNVWTDSNIVAVTPFLLSAEGGPFTTFSLMDAGGQPSLIYKAIFDLTKIKGLPKLSPDVLGTNIQAYASTNLPIENFSKTILPNDSRITLSPELKTFFKLLLGLHY